MNSLFKNKQKTVNLQLKLLTKLDLFYLKQNGDNLKDPYCINHNYQPDKEMIKSKDTA